MGLDIKKITLKGHNSFYLRDGWLNKVFLCENIKSLKNKLEAAEILGVGSGMVKAIKFYLTAMNLVKFSNREKLETKLFEAIKSNDKYIEQYFTKYILHYELISNANKAPTWYTFFNYIKYDEITKEEMFTFIKDIYIETLPDKSISASSLESDISCLINLYTKNKEKKLTPEDNLESPFVELLLLEFDGKLLRKKVPPQNILDKMVILYIIMSEIKRKNNFAGKGMYNISMEDLISAPNNIGKILNMGRSDIYHYLYELEKAKLLKFHETAGIDQIYVDYIEKEEVITRYFKGIDNV